MNDTSNKIIIYSAPDGGVEIKTEIKNDTIWLTQEEIARLFGVKRPSVTRHLNGIYKNEELSEKSTCSFFEHVGKQREKRTYRTKFYNLDAIISVGYRVNSKKATQFRVWATTTLRKYLVDGYVINQNRIAEQEQKLLEIQRTVELIREKSKTRELIGHEKELLDIISEYTKSLVLLNKFDANNLQIGKVNRYIRYELTYDDQQEIVESIRENYGGKDGFSQLFGQEREDKIKGILGSISQTFEGKELYESIEEKAAHLLYFTIKDHPYMDGNKRIGSILFIYFLRVNGHLTKKNGEPKINDNAMVALALLIAVSNPVEKENIIKLIINLIKE